MPDERRFTHLLCGQIHVRAEASDDDAVAALASRQRGIARRSQLLEIGVGRRSIDYRLEVGRLRHLFRGVYAVGHEAVPFDGRALAAVMAMSPNAAASHVTALALSGLCEPPPGAIHVTAVGSRRQPKRGLIVHRGLLPPDELTLVDGVPATTVARALLDLSSTGDERRLRRLIKKAEFDDLITLEELDAILARYPRRRGRRTLATIVDSEGIRIGKTRSEFEDLFVEFCVTRGLPIPETNAPLEIGGERIEVDCLWRTARLVVELDGYRAHGDRLAFERDRARDRALAAAQWLPMRITWRQFQDAPEALEADLRKTLATRRDDNRRSRPTGGG